MTPFSIGAAELGNTLEAGEVRQPPDWRSLSFTVGLTRGGQAFG